MKAVAMGTGLFAGVLAKFVRCRVWNEILMSRWIQTQQL